MPHIVVLSYCHITYYAVSLVGARVTGEIPNSLSLTSEKKKFCSLVRFENRNVNPFDKRGDPTVYCTRTVLYTERLSRLEGERAMMCEEEERERERGGKMDSQTLPGRCAHYITHIPNRTN